MYSFISGNRDYLIHPFKISTSDTSIVVMINKDSLSFDPLFQLSAYVQRSRGIISASSC